jgi:hypothetical protein
MSQGKHMTDDEIIEANCRQNFAAARGARLRIFEYETRIHPDDEHLQYGPISTALLKLAEDDSWNPSEERALALAVARQFQVFFGDEPDYPLFYLFLAEFLADSGL